MINFRLYLFLTVSVSILVFNHINLLSGQALFSKHLPEEAFINKNITLATYSTHPGFPITVPGHVTYSSPTIVDINNDGSNELIVGTYNGEIYAWNESGTLLSGYPLTTNGHIIGHLAFGDLNNNGDLELVAGANSTEDGKQGKVYVWRPNGNLLPGWPQSVARFGNVRPSKISSVVLSDIDNDNDLEIIAGTNNNVVGTGADPNLDVPDLYVWERNGNLAAGNWPAKDEPSILGTIAVGDFNGDGKNNILVGRDYNWLFAYDNQGNNLAGWPVVTYVDPSGSDNNTDPRIVHKRSSPTLADLNADGEFEYIVTGVRKMPGSSEPVNSDLLIFKPNGTRQTGWENPASATGILGNDFDMQQGAAIADINGDNRLDTIVAHQDGYVRAYTADKNLLWEFDYAQGSLIHASEPIVGNVDNDSFYEVIFGAHDPNLGNASPVGLWILEHDGSPKAGMPLAVTTPGIMAPPTLGDLDNDGLLEIAAASRTGRIYVWDTPAALNPFRMPWPVARHDIQRTAFFNDTGFDGQKINLQSGADHGQPITYTIQLIRYDTPLTYLIHITDIIPAGLQYIPGTLTASHGIPDDTLAPTLHWTGRLSDTNQIEISYSTNVVTTDTLLLSNTVTLDSIATGTFTRTAVIISNPKRAYLPILLKH